jgi:RNA polymerase sigma-70 factor (subfamily 1)
VDADGTSERQGASDDAGALVRAAQAGDPRALETLLGRHVPRLRAFVRLRMDAAFRTRESRSDVVQSTCREVLEGLAGFEYRDEASFRAWLHTVALNKLREKARYHRAERRDPGREVAAIGGAEDLLEGYAHLAEPGAGPSAIASADEEARRIEAAFDALEPHYREVITLSRISGLGSAEIGRRMGKSDAAVRQLLGRALVRLSALLEAG